jgi:hypothetical protein
MLLGDSEDDWAVLVEQYIIAMLNIQSGASEDDIIEILSEARDIIEDCDEIGLERSSRAKDLIQNIELYNTGQLGVNLCQELPCCFFNGWGSWGECTTQCGGGLSYRYEKCNCPAFQGGIQDDSWCAGEKNVETEACNIQNCTDNEINDPSEHQANNSTHPKTIHYWQKYTPWPISEKTLFECFSGTSSYSQLNWYQILTLDNPDPTDLWLILAQEYILFQLNYANIHISDPNCEEILKKARFLLGYCDGFGESDQDAVQLLIQVLKEYNHGNITNTVNTLQALSFIMGQAQEIQSPYPISSDKITILTIFSIVLLSVVIFSIWKNCKSSDNIVTLDPEFDLPDPEDELVPGTTVKESGGEEDLSYELGELDGVNLVD